MSSHDKKGKTDAFGRDEMMAMLGGGLSETLTRRAVPTGGPGGTAVAAAAAHKAKPDISELTTAETAALLLEQSKQKKVGAGDKGGSTKHGAQHRHRTHKVRAYHQLLQEQAMAMASTAAEDATAGVSTSVHASVTNGALNTTAEDDIDRLDDDFVSQSKTSARKPQMFQRHYESSSSSEDVEPVRRRIGSDSSSDDDDEADIRRKRLLQKRKTQSEGPADSEHRSQSQSQAEAIQNSSSTEKPMLSVGRSAMQTAQSSSSGSSSSSDSEEDVPVQKPPRPADTTISSSSSGSSSSSESSSDSSSSDDEDDVHLTSSRPVFVPRHKRSLVQQQQADEEELETQERLRQENHNKRRQESRAMVQQVLVASAQAAPDWNDAFEGITSARNPVPDDNDDDGSLERDAWEVRELLRLIEDLDAEQARLAEESELTRRRMMTDDERLKEDIAAGRFKRPGEQRQKTSEESQSKRYFHKGAFYMDEDEFAEGDVRQRAEEYARAATASDKVHNKNLPKIMQVKKFGFANQSKYKGLAAEDTTDRKAEMLPLQRKK